MNPKKPSAGIDGKIQTQAPPPADAAPPIPATAGVAAPAPEPPQKKSRAIMLTADFGEIYCKAGPDGQLLRPIRTSMRLYSRLKHFYQLADRKGKWKMEDEDEEGQGTTPAESRERLEDFQWPLTIGGYRHLNKAGGVSILTPQSVVVAGKLQPNPYVEQAGVTKAITGVAIRKIGIGYSLIGNVVVVDKSLYYNPYTYFIQSLQAVMKKRWWFNKPAENIVKGEPKHPNAAIYGTANENPANAKPPRPGRWSFYLVEEPVGIWINIDDPAIQDCMNEHTQRQRFGDRIAQTIVERNILKDHPAIGVSSVLVKKFSGGGYFADVALYGWRGDLGPSQLADILAQAEKAEGTSRFQLIQSGSAEPDLEAEREAMAEAVEDEHASGVEQAEEPAGEPEPTAGASAEGSLFQGAGKK